MKASRVIAAYTRHEQAAPLVAQVRPPVFPLDDSATRRDDALSGQQKRIGAAAHAVYLALTVANSCSDQLAALLPPPPPHPPCRTVSQVRLCRCKGFYARIWPMLWATPYAF